MQNGEAILLYPGGAKEVSKILNPKLQTLWWIHPKGTSLFMDILEENLFLHLLFSFEGKWCLWLFDSYGFEL